MAVSRNTKRSDIWNLIDTRIRNTITTTSIKGGAETVTIQNYANAYGDERFDSKAGYPIIVINSPNKSDENFTALKDKDNFTIDIEIFSTQKEACENFMDAIEETILTYKKELAAEGLQQIHLDDDDMDYFDRSGIKVHYGLLRFSFIYTHAKEAGY